MRLPFLHHSVEKVSSSPNYSVEKVYSIAIYSVEKVYQLLIIRWKKCHLPQLFGRKSVLTIDYSVEKV